MIKMNNRGDILTVLILVPLFAALAMWGWTAYTGVKTIRDLLKENKKLREAITNLTHEDQIGYAKVVRQERRGGRLHTTLIFVETARDDKLKQILRKEYTVEGDVIHFDALIVKFKNQMVLDGKERAMYLWRRVYGEYMTPSEGFPIETEGDEPARYEGLLAKLSIQDRVMFWSHIWDLASNPQKLHEYDIEAIYGNVVYTKLREGLIYVFKISATGQVYPETVPVM